MSDPVPVVNVAGVDLSPGPGGGPLPRQCVVDGFSVRWGRSDVMEQAAAPVGSLTVFDATRTWALTTPLDGAPVVMRAEGFTDAGVPVSWEFYRGRVAKVTVARKTVTTPAGPVHGSLVTLTLRSVLTDLANRVPTDAWPEEQLQARAVRLQPLHLDVATGSPSRSDAPWATSTVAAVDVGSQRSVWAHLLALSEFAGSDRLTYYPDRTEVALVPRRKYALRGLAGLVKAPAGTPRAGLGAFIRPHTIGSALASMPVEGTYLDAARTQLDDATVSRPPRVTRVQVSYRDTAAGAERTVEALVSGMDEAALGQQVAKLDSISATAGTAGAVAAELVDLVRHEGSTWRVGSVRYRPPGGFDDHSQAFLLLYGGETRALVFLQGSWLPSYGLRPIFGLMGGAITYRRQTWDVEMDLSPVATSVPQHAITWDEIDDGTAANEVQWWDSDHPKGMHESVTYEDLGYVATGLGVTVIPADRGHDE